MSDAHGPINDYVEELRRRHPGRRIPDVGSDSGGVDAPLLIVLRQPNLTGAADTGLVSYSNPDRAAPATVARLTEAGVPLTDATPWNLVPWFPDERQGKHIPAADRRAGAACLLGLLPRLRRRPLAVVLMGQHPCLALERGGLGHPPAGVRFFAAPSPSPPAGNRTAAKAAIAATLKEAYAWANGDGDGPRP